MTTQTKEQQAVALALELAANNNAHIHKYGTDSIVFYRDSDLVAMLADHAQQVREAHTAELVANAGVMSEVYAFELAEWCPADEVREAIAALQAQYESAKEAAVLLAMLTRESADEVFKLRARVAELERDAEMLNFLDNEANELRTVATAEDDFDWVVISNHIDKPHERELGRGKTARAAIDAAMKKGGGVDTTGSNPNPPECDPRA